MPKHSNSGFTRLIVNFKLIRFPSKKWIDSHCYGGFGNQSLPGKVSPTSICNKYHRAPCFWSGFWWLLIRDNPWMRWVNSGCFMDFLVLFFGYLMSSLLVQVPQALSLGQNALCDDMLHLQETAHCKNQFTNLGYREKTWKIRQLLVRFYEEITQKGGPHHPSPNRNHEATLGGVSPISQGTSRNNYESKKSHQWNFQTDHGYPNLH